jgi:hypothetical protein
MNDADWIKFLLGVMFTLLCSWGSYMAGARGKMSVSQCAKCQALCQEKMIARIDAEAAKRDELAKSQDKLAASLYKKNEILFRMVRALVVHSSIPKDEQEKILNDREAK